MKRIFFILIIFTLLFGETNFVFAAQVSGSPIVTESTVSVNVNTYDTSVILEVYNQQNKKVAGPTTTSGSSPIKATINVSNLSRGTTYILKGQDKDSSLGGDTFSLNFNTVTTDTRVTGSGDWYYTVGIILANYDTNRDKSLFVFTSELACNAARTAKIDDLYSAESVAGGGVKNSTITPCFQSKTIPTKKEFESKLQSIDGMQGSKKLYYFTYGYKTDKIFQRSKGYDTQKECESAQELYKDQIVMSCTALSSAPTEPSNWDSLLDGDAKNVDPQGNRSFNDEYTLLAPIGNLTKIGNNTNTKIGDYLNIILLIAIGLCGALAVIMIVVYGVQYMGDESVFGKTEAKSHIMQAVLGLLLALGAYAILNTISPKLVGGTLTFNSVNIELEGDVNAPVNINKADSKSLGIVCNGGGKTQIPTIVRSFAGKMTYSQDIPKGQAGPNNTIKLDCSGFVNYVLSCADVDNSKINSGTSVIFSNAEKVTSITDTQVNGVDLKVGDLIGWRPQDDKKGNGHVMIYIGGGQVADSHGGKNRGRIPGNALGIFSTTKWKSNVTYIKRM